ncbi:MAG: hypothetical protein J6J62_02215 [Oscillospiraceae bacterium]|nr:hypothetical protein [Oscillospiraceae bacterium]
MKIMLRYAFDYNPKIIEILDAHSVKYELGTHQCIYFKIPSDHECIPVLKAISPDLKPDFSHYKFSDKEMNEAEWFTMRSTNNKLENVLDEKTFEFSCKFTKRINVWAPSREAGTRFVPEDVDFYGHETQVAPYYFSKKIKWGRNFFYSVLRRGTEDFFCNELAKNIITQSGLKGASFLSPLKKQTNEPIEDVYQFIIDNIIPESSCEVVDYRDIYHCPVCGKKEYAMDTLSRPRVNKAALGDQDFYATEPILTWGNDWCIPDHFSIISHRAYEVFKASGFTRTLEIAPLLTY